MKAELSRRGGKTSKGGRRKRRRQRGPDGEPLEGGDEFEEDEEGESEEEGEEAGAAGDRGSDPSALLKEQQEKIEAEKKALMENQEMIAEVGQKLSLALTLYK